MLKPIHAAWSCRALKIVMSVGDEEMQVAQKLADPDSIARDSLHPTIIRKASMRYLEIDVVSYYTLF